jgi:O-antigen/teichoic acid export membrane protein
MVSAGLGFVFWVLAARMLPQTEVGREGALVTALVALAGASQLNLAATLPRFLPQVRTGAARLVKLAFALCAAAALVIATLFAVIVPSLSDSLASASDEPALYTLFVTGVVLMTVMAVQDAALASVRTARWIPVEQLIYNGLRVLVLVLAASLGVAHEIMLAWVLPLIVILPLSAQRLFGAALPAHAARDREGKTATPAVSRRVLPRFLAADTVAFLMRQATAATMPILVLAYVGPVEAAAFTVPFALTFAFEVFFGGAATALTIEGAQHGAQLAGLVRALIRRFLVPTLAIAALLAVAAPIVLLPFGSDYTGEGADALRFLALGTGLRALLIVMEALQRLRGSLGPVVAFSAIPLVGVAVLGPMLIDAHGIEGGGATWFAAHALAVVAVAPFGWRTVQDALRR